MVALRSSASFFKPILRSLSPVQQITKYRFHSKQYVANNEFPAGADGRMSKRRFLKAVGATIGGLLAFDYAANDLVYTNASIRFLRSLKTAVSISADYIWLFARHDESEDEYNRLLKCVHSRCAARILTTCLANGGLYIKVGQGVAAINHILPVEYTRTLSKLQNECLSAEVLDVKRIFKEDFNSSPEEMFLNFDYEPKAAASLAQVFRATGKNGEDLAVKIQYNDLQKRFTSDLGTIIFLQDVIEIFFKDYNFGWIIRDVRKNLEQELDFMIEGRNAERAAKDLAILKYVHVPKVYWELSGTRVLTAEWIDGRKVDDLEWLNKENVSLSEVDVKLFNLFSEQIFNTGFVHADPHPGNIFLRKDKCGRLQVVLLDHGLYEWVPDDIRLKLCKFWEATVLRDEETMKETAASLQISNYKQFAEILFQTPIDLSANVIKTKLTEKDIELIQNLAKNNFGYIMQALRDMPRNLLFVVRNLNTVRAIGREHGDPVDRPKLMARYAQSCLYRNENRVLGYFKWLCRRVRFEYCLFKASFKMLTVSIYIDILHKLGRSPQDSSLLRMRVENL